MVTRQTAYVATVEAVRGQIVEHVGIRISPLPLRYPEKLAVSMGYIPARASVGMPAWLPPGTNIKLMPTDIPHVVQTNSANLKRFADLFGN